MIVLTGSPKGGVGKSTISINLAVAAQATGLKVQLVEADPTIHTTSYWADDRDEAGLPHILTVRKTGKINTALQEMERDYDLVIVDAGKDTQEMRTAMAVADVLVLPSKPSQTDLESSKELLPTIEMAQSINPNLRPLLVLSQASTHAFNNDVKDAREYIGDALPMADVVIYQRDAYAKCLKTGMGVVEMNNPKAKAEIQLLLNEVLQEAGK